MNFTKKLHLKENFPLALISLMLLLNFITSNTLNSKESNKCFILALEGGGDKGAYQAGVLKGMMNKLEKEKRSYDIVTGISVGSINAGSILTFPKGQETEAADFLLQAWRNIKGNSDIYQNWQFGVLQGLLFKNSIYDASPLKTLLEATLKNRKISRKFVIGATRAKDGKYQTWDETEISQISDLITVIRSSAAMPVLFSSIKNNEEYYMDGGVLNNIDIFSGINKCFDMGFKEEDIVVDVIRCKPNKLVQVKDVSEFTSLKMLGRYIDISTNNFFMSELNEIYKNFPDVNYRYLITPEKDLPSSFPPLNFTKEEVEKMIAIGIEDGEDFIKKYKNGNWREALELHNNSRKMKYSRNEWLMRKKGKESKILESSESDNSSFSSSMKFLD